MKRQPVLTSSLVHVIVLIPTFSSTVTIVGVGVAVPKIWLGRLEMFLDSGTTPARQLQIFPSHVLLMCRFEQLLARTTINRKDLLHPEQRHKLLAVVNFDIFDLSPVKSVPNEWFFLEEVMELFTDSDAANSSMVLDKFGDKHILPKHVIPHNLAPDDAT